MAPPPKPPPPSAPPVPPSPAPPSLHLPGVAGELARRGFGGEAVRLMLEWGGTKRTIPQNPVPGSPLVGVVGMDAALVLAALYGNTQVDIPSKGTLEETLKAGILRRAGNGDGTRAIAMALGCTERYVRAVLRRSGTPPRPDPRGRDSRQLDLIAYLKAR